ncbi:MAG: SDR family NAD(P)-dependent oxidoreductase [Actinophytocola sp.]|uniref:SDR family NAD(P)-dependent oxidoreductase n=1 Tax=Actinophytocola sp. TaxID=1872138 RepID=UPI003C70A08E
MTESVLVTGGTGGLGTAVVAAFADAGWRVVVPYRTREPVGAIGVRADLTDPAQVAAAVEVAASDGPLKAVVHLAGGFAMGGRVHETPVEEFEAQFHTNLRPTYLVSAAAIPHLIAAGGGSIVCVSSKAAVHPFAGAAGYVTSKAAVLALVGAMNAEYGGDGIRVNAILPGVIDTPANRESMPGNHDTWVPPTNIAKTILFLATNASTPITNAQIPVDNP